MLKDMFIKEHEEALKATKKVCSLVIPPSSEEALKATKKVSFS